MSLLTNRVEKLENRAEQLEFERKEKSLKRQLIARGIVDPDDQEGWLLTLSEEQYAKWREFHRRKLADLISVDINELPNPALMTEEEQLQWSQWATEFHESVSHSDDEKLSVGELKTWLDFLTEYEPMREQQGR